MVIQLVTMNFNFLLYCIVVFYGFQGIENYETSDLKSQVACEDDICRNKDHHESEKTLHYEIPVSKINHDFSFGNKTKNISEKEFYFVAASEQPLSAILERNLLHNETETDKKLEVFLGTSEKNNLSAEISKGLYNATDLTEINDFTDKTIVTSTFEPNATKIISTSITKLSTFTTQTPSTESHSFLSQNSKKRKGVCFCDIQVNQCDINCCCDEDCNIFHFKVFTKCIDHNVLDDTKYCYKRNFIFENNTSYDMIQSNGGLFCIVRDNFKVGLNYETKTVLTNLEEFNKSLQSNPFAFSLKSPKKFEFISNKYLAISPVWTVQNGEIIPFKIPHSSVGFLCNSELNIKYLVDEIKICFYQRQKHQSQCRGTKVEDVIHSLKHTKFISNPDFFNKTEAKNSSVICETNACVGITFYLCELIGNGTQCKEIENFKDFTQSSCWADLSHVKYQILHNGTEGIIKVKAFLWIRQLPKISGEFLLQLITEVRFVWVSSTKEIFKRSGNPGYLTGKPILAGRKVFILVNDSSEKKEAIELSVDSKDWLSVLGSERGICSSKKRIPINFRENGHYMCSMQVSKNNFSKEKCTEMQNNIFKLLIENNIINETKENFFNKFVATFGNSRVEETGDWVQVLIDLFPIISSQVSFKSNYYHLMCKNIITDLYINIVYSNIGSFLAPQAKILGVSFQFGKHKDISYFCDSPGCENTSLIQYFKLTSTVHFVDLTKPPTEEFAEPLSLEAKLPHDFFYPFFSKSHRTQFLNKFFFVLFLSACLYSSVAHKIAI